MAFESITDELISELITCPKRVLNANARSKQKDGHEQYNFNAIAIDGTDREFLIYKRQNLRSGVEDDFSCGFAWIASNGELLTLKRYNGSSHAHSNIIEKEKLGYVCHVHIATERYIKANRKPEGFAVVTNSYNSVNGAMHCLVKDCNITGITTYSDNISQIRLFE